MNDFLLGMIVGAFAGAFTTAVIIWAWLVRDDV